MEIHTRQLIHAMQFDGSNVKEILEFDNRYRSTYYLSTIEIQGWVKGDWWVLDSPSSGRVWSDQDMKLWHGAEIFKNTP